MPQKAAETNGDPREELVEQATRQALNVALFGGAEAVMSAIDPVWLTHSHRLILEAAVAAEREGWTPDPLSVRMWLAQQQTVTPTTERELLKALDYPGSVSNLTLYAEIIRKGWQEKRSSHLSVVIAGETDPVKLAELGHELAQVTAPKIELGPEDSDAGNADRLIAAAAGRLRHCAALGDGERGWLWWNGNHWERRARHRAYALLVDATRDRLRGVGAGDKAELRFVHGSLQETRLRACVRLAEMVPGVSIRPDELDRNPWLLTCSNGTVDLSTGELLTPQPEHFITRTISCDYDLSAPAPQWDAFLHRVMGGRTELVSYLRAAVGYSLTGLTREQVFFLLHGSGANGKSTFIETIATLLGEYAHAAPFETFTITHNQNSEREMFPLRGARFVSSVEAENGQRLAESFVKRATGGDTVSARALYTESINFTPEFKLWLAANHLPEIRGTDEAIWRRVRLIPFEITIPESERDPELKHKLRLELPGILRWAAMGCYAWAIGGMPKTSIVMAASQQYREDQDWIGEFLRDCCELGPNDACDASRLYSAFKGWAEKQGVKKIPTQKKLGIILKERGFEPIRVASARGWRGVTVRGGS